MIRRKGISRIDQPEKHNHGWLVQVTFEGKTHRKWFSDNKHGGKKKAFAQAVIWRDKTEKALGKPQTGRVVVRFRRNRYGVTGVQWDKRHQAFIVSINPEPGKQKRFYVPAKGRKKTEALEEAKKLRLKLEKDIYAKRGA